ncbi:MAG: lysophospholipid acyltransferase family protein [Candidatus Hydrogenedens sp.]|jgi:KDO2-lipid IV(A) lauroyltransferase|nr:lysophospholipid acyltransferase family protein [Candidatus Hydrogenedens sp.]
MAKARSPFAGLSYFFCLLFFKLTRMLPLFVVRRLGCFLGDLAYMLIPRLKRIGFSNLDIAYGDSLSFQAKKKILRGAVRNLGIVAAEFSRIPLVVAGKLKDQISVEGLEHAQESDKAVFLAAHHSNWEWMPPTASLLGLKTAVIIRPLNNPFLDKLVDRLRISGGTITITKDGAIQEMLSMIEKGVHPSMLADQGPRDGAVPVHFFGSPAWGSIGPALIAMKAGVPVVPGSMARNAEGKYSLRFYPKVIMQDSGNFLEDLLENTQRCQDALEAIIRAHPEQWLWFHRRWRKRERLEKEWQMRLERPLEKLDFKQQPLPKENS